MLGYFRLAAALAPVASGGLGRRLARLRRRRMGRPRAGQCAHIHNGTSMVRSQNCFMQPSVNQIQVARPIDKDRNVFLERAQTAAEHFGYC